MLALLHDLRFGLRLLAKAPAFTAAAILSLALGIGANTTVYVWVRQLLVEPLPGVRAAGELVVLANSDSGSSMDMSHADFLDLQRETRTLAGVCATRWTTLNLAERGPAERIYGQIASGATFRVLGVRPALGRLFDEQDELPGAGQSVVLSHAFWQRRFAGDPGVVGRSLRINGMPRTILGVAPAGFGGNLGGLAFDVWVPLRPFMQAMGSQEVLDNRRYRCWYVMGRLNPGVTPVQAQGELSRLAAELERVHPEDNRGMGVKLLSLGHSTQGVQSLAVQPLPVLFGAVALVLLIACVNVANLILAKAAGREQELAIRRALGATRGRILRQLLTESLIMGCAAGAVGFLLSLGATRVLWLLAPPTYLPMHFQSSVEPRTAAFALGLSLLTSLLFGILPALRTAWSERMEALRQGSLRSTGGHRTRRLQGTLVVLEVALSVMLLIGAALLLKSFERTRRADPGFDAHQVTVAGFGVESSGYDRARAARISRSFLDRVRALPGVQQAALSQELVMGLEGNSWDYVQVEGREEAPRERLRILRNVVTPGYFATLRMPLLEGRDFTDLDGPDSLPVVLVNQAMARKCWPGQSPLGRRIRCGNTFWTVVGVAASARSRTWADPVAPFFYFPNAQYDDGAHTLNVRSSAPAATLRAQVQAALRELDPDLPLLTESLERVMESSAWAISLAAKVLTAMGLMAALLAAVGIYGVMALSVSQRVPEFGIRMSLGAGPGRILAMVLRQGGGLILAGTGLGLAGAVALSRALSSLLVQVDPLDPAVFAGVSLLLAAIALGACALPALRASRTSPLHALSQS